MREYMLENAPDAMDLATIEAWGWQVMDFDPETGDGVAFHNDLNTYTSFVSWEAEVWPAREDNVVCGCGSMLPPEICHER